MICPHCQAEITDQQFMRLRGQYAQSKRKSNGGGRPKRDDERIPLGGSKPRQLPIPEKPAHRLKDARARGVKPAQRVVVAASKLLLDSLLSPLRG